MRPTLTIFLPPCFHATALLSGRFPLLESLHPTTPLCFQDHVQTLLLHRTSQVFSLLWLPETLEASGPTAVENHHVTSVHPIPSPEQILTLQFFLKITMEGLQGGLRAGSSPLETMSGEGIRHT